MSSLSTLSSSFLTRHSGAVIVAAVALTALLVPSMLLLAPDESASTDPGGEVFDLRDEIEEKLGSSRFVTAYIAEADDGEGPRAFPSGRGPSGL